MGDDLLETAPCSRPAGLAWAVGHDPCGQPSVSDVGTAQEVYEHLRNIDHIPDPPGRPTN